MGFEQAGSALFLEPVRFPFDVHGGRVVEQAVEQGARDHGVAKDLTPGAEALIAGEQDRAPLIAPGDELEKEIGSLPVDRDVPDLVDDQELGLGEQFEALLEAILEERLAERGNEAGRRREEGPVAELAGLEADRDGQMRLAHARRAEEQDVLPIGEKASGGELLEVAKLLLEMILEEGGCVLKHWVFQHY